MKAMPTHNATKPDGWDYISEKFHQAVWSLMGEGAQDERLNGAMQYLTRLMSVDIPDETFRKRYLGIMKNEQTKDERQALLEEILALHDIAVSRSPIWIAVAT